MEDDRYRDLVLAAWRKDFYGCSMYRVCRRLKYLKEALKVVNLQSFSHLKQRVAESRFALKEAQEELEVDPRNDVLRMCEQDALEQFKSVQSLLLAQQRQQAKLLWVKEGDRNSRLFHSAINKRYRGNSILMLMDEQGQRHHSQETIADMVVAYYRNLLGTCVEVEVEQEVVALGPLGPDSARLYLECDVTET